MTFAQDQHAFWQHTMLRIKDPKISLPFYEKEFGMQLIHSYHFSQWKFSVYFLGTLPEGLTAPEPNTPESEKFLWSTNLTVLELTHNHGDEEKSELRYNSGNVEPHRGFGHIAFHCNDVYAACTELEAHGAKFQKKPDEGRMKGIAFVLDPDGYWIELIKRSEGHTIKRPFNLSQTMIRVKDPKAALAFYRDLFGMTLVKESHLSDFSLYFLKNVAAGEEHPDVQDSQNASNWVNAHFSPVLELTHNHGTESNPDFHYHDGNAEPRGFGHLAFLVDDLAATEKALDAANVTWKKRPQDGSMRGIAFVKDPDGYWVELVQRGVHMDNN